MRTKFAKEDEQMPIDEWLASVENAAQLLQGGEPELEGEHHDTEMVPFAKAVQLNKRKKLVPREGGDHKT